MIDLLVYGTLREGGRLRPFYKLTTVETGLVLLGYTMVDVSNNRKVYPIAVENEGTEIIVDHVQVDENHFVNLNAMEAGAGYHVIKVPHPVTGKECRMFVHNRETIDFSKKTLIRDWIQYVESEILESPVTVRDAQPL